MKKLSISFTILFVACFLSVQATMAQGTRRGSGAKSVTAIPGDARVVRALNQIKTKYEMNQDGLFVINFELTNKRLQKALISSETDKAFGSETRVVFSYALISDKPPSQEVANLLLKQNLGNVGTWAVDKTGDGMYFIANIIHLPADADGKRLEDAMNIVISAADEMEAQLTKKDEL